MKGAGVVGLLLALAVGMTYPIAFDGRSLMLESGAGEDAFIFLWNSWWTKRAVVDLHAWPYFTPMLYHPHGTGLGMHSYPMVYALASIPFQLAEPGLTGLIRGNNVTVVLSFFLASLGMYLLAHHVSRHRAAAVVAAIFYAYADFRFANTVRLHCLSTEWLPFFVLLLLRWARSGRARDAVGTGLFLVAILYSSLEYFAFTIVLIPFLLTAVVLVGRRRYRLANVVRLGPFGAFLAAFFLTASPLLPALLPYLRAKPTFKLPIHFSADVCDFFLPGARHPHWGKAIAPVTAGFHAGDPGFGMAISYVGWGLFALFLILYLTRRQRRTLTGLWAVGALGCLVLALGPRLHLAGRIFEFDMPYAYLWKLIPPLQASRCPMRWVVFAELFMGVGISLSAAWVLRRRERWARIALGLAVLAMVYELHNGRMTMTPIDVPAYYVEIARDPGAGCVLHFPEPWCRENMLYQTVHHKPLAWEMTRCLPHGSRRSFASLAKGELGRLWKAIRDDPARAFTRPGEGERPEALLRAVLDRFKPSHVIIRAGHMRPDQTARALAILSGSGAREVRQCDGAHVYVFDGPDDSNGPSRVPATRQH